MKYLGYSFVIKRGPIDYDMVQVIVGLWIPVSEARSLVCIVLNGIHLHGYFDSLQDA